MPNSSTLLFAWTMRILTAMFLLNVPSEFWTQVLDILNFPDEVKIAVAPFFGSACATAVEYLITQKDANQKPWHWPLKLFVGWVAGSYGGGSADIIFKGTPETLAFWGGVLGYGSVVLALAQQKKKLKDTQSDDNTHGD